ncbi:MAG TPA: nicotinate-nucleotide adenylyltransferase [Dictyoglomaceae bacterium]|nr:nicotinate-nucleotide adenylyltransferase [Dictyoglomaceae bacterium]HOL38891.1 nicotinate-nucleotide adenylyltransferase [Dictyoglomaceae bacterium]HOP94921.1 nicotinate-nucleotide adenylyltransferase [Dictyoglomaceae bacterium]HPP15692.1 nicotinate-nucleotide adenylyltransferase [Dictyoglomaceae bacterium]HPU43531.1 nicotinate-nucleotide adenylyltransferase [Dictyoglomaceae bacterium]
MKKLGILGGTFDPIHYGHLWFAEFARESFSLDKVFLIPNKMPPHRDVPNASPKQRYEMTLLAAIDNPYLEVLPIELEREGLSYTIDTLRELKKIYPNDELYLLLGKDAFCDFLKWKSPYEILEVAKIIVGNRKEGDLNDSIKSFLEEYGNKIFFLDFPYFPISAREIRERVENGLSIKYLVPKLVEEYIIKNRLYK